MKVRDLRGFSIDVIENKWPYLNGETQDLSIFELPGSSSNPRLPIDASSGQPPAFSSQLMPSLRPDNEGPMADPSPEDGLGSQGEFRVSSFEFRSFLAPAT